MGRRRGGPSAATPAPGAPSACGPRVTLVLFGLGALLLSVLMGCLSYFTARHFLVSERQNASLHQAYVNAKLVRSTLSLAELSTTGIVKLLSATPTRGSPAPTPSST